METRRVAFSLGVVAWLTCVAMVASVWSSPMFDEPSLHAVILVSLVALVPVLFAARQVGPPWVAAAGPAMLLVLLAPAIGTEVDSPSIRVVCSAVAALFLPFAACAVGTIDPPRIGAPARAACWLTAAAMIGVDVFVRQPFAELNCWPLCAVNSLRIGGSAQIVTWTRWVFVLTAASFAMLLVGGPTRRQASGARAGRVLIAAAVSWFAVAMVRRPAILPASRTAQLTIAAAIVCSGIGLLALNSSGIRLLLARRRVRRLTRDLHRLAQPDGVTALLRRVVGDAGIEVYTTPPPADLIEPAHQAVTQARRGDEVVASIVHRAERSEAVRAALTPAVVTVLENQHMLSAARVQLAALQHARQQVVERSDATHRRLERDLHDGAQQRLLLLGLRLDELRHLDSGPDGLALTQAVDEASEALAELRRIAHGSMPPLLDEQGLPEALHSLAETDRIAIDVDTDNSTGRRHPPPVERAAYCFVVACVDRAANSRAPWIDVGIADDASGLRVWCQYDGPLDFDHEDSLDRISAAGGSMSTSTTATALRHEVRFP